MNRRMWRLLTVSLLMLLCFNEYAHAQPADMLDQLIPGEQQMGIVPGERTLDYKTYPIDHYGWDIGFDLVEWEGWRPTFHDPYIIIVSGLSNFLFYLNTLLVRLSIFFMQLGFHTDLVNEQLSIVLPIMNGLQTSLFGKFLPFMLVFLVWWMVKVGYWNNETTRFTSGVVGSILILAAGFWFMANAGHSIKLVSKTMDSLTLITMGSLAAPYQAVTGESVTDSGLMKAADQQLLATSNRIWKLFVDRPWMIGEFNREDASAVRVTQEEYRQLAKMAKEEEVKMNVRVGDAWPHLIRQYAPGMPQRDILRKVLGSPKINHGAHHDIPYLFWGGASGTRFLIALLSLIATLTLLLFVGTVSFILVVAQELALGLIMLSPIVFLLGIYPERGFGVARRWLGWLIGALGTKVVYGFYLGFTLLLSDIVARGSGLLLIQQLFVGLLFFCAFLFRKRILEQLLGLLKAPAPHDMVHTTREEVSQHWNEAKDSWNKTNDAWNKAKTAWKKWVEP